MGFLFGKVTEQMIENFNAELIPYQIDSKEFGFLTVITSMPEATQQQVENFYILIGLLQLKILLIAEFITFSLLIKVNSCLRNFGLH